MEIGRDPFISSVSNEQNEELLSPLLTVWDGNFPIQENPVYTESPREKRRKTEEPGKLELQFVGSHIFKDDSDPRCPYTVKVNKLLELTVNYPYEEQWIVMGLIHSHPNYVNKIIKCFSRKQGKEVPELGCPIDCKNPIKYYRLVLISGLDAPMIAVLTRVHRGKINVEFPVVSTDLASESSKN